MLRETLMSAVCHYRPSGAFGGNEGGPPDVGQFLLAIAPQAFGNHGSFSERLEIMLEALCEDEGVRLPGDSRWGNRKRAAQDGIEVPKALIETLEAYA